MNYKDRYNCWIKDDYFDSEVREELLSIADDEEEIKDRFYKDLEFGTAGLRGVVGYGTNRMNKYTVAKATQGIAYYVLENSKSEEKTAVISYDGRIKSDEFALIAARVFAANGIKTYLFKGMKPTPEASFAVRELRTDTGVMITASHNPPEYNGYKAYGSDGAQYSTTDSEKITEKFNQIRSYEEIKIISEEEAREKKLILDVPDSVDNRYIEEVLNLSLRDDIDKDINIVYTPLHGVGAENVLKVLDRRGFMNVHTVKEQKKPDGNFPTLEYPNPEDIKAFELAITLAKEKKADIIIATDPDTDRVAALIERDGEYHKISGNEMGYLLMDYILSEKKKRNELPENGVLVKTIVSSRFTESIADDYGLEYRDVYTGFKNIAKAIRELEAEDKGEYIFGYEESIGYLPETFVRDKDAVSTTMLIAEMTAAYKKDGIHLLDRLDELYRKYGYFEEKLYSVILKGIKGREIIDKIMEEFRSNYPEMIGKSVLVEMKDYREQKGYKADYVYDLGYDEKENAVKYIFDDKSWYVMRPSGTEPKIKIYIYATDKDKDIAKNKVDEISKVVDDIIKNIEDENN
ncbi:MAG: phospho-sugar mutase [Andreesenia angusta]|nr:phospho-sugar mutase [Andreesenia angusta]